MYEFHASAVPQNESAREDSRGHRDEPISPELSTCCQFAQRNYTCKLRRLHKHHFADDKNKLTEAIERGFISLTRPGQARHAFDDCVYPILV